MSINEKHYMLNGQITTKTGYAPSYFSAVANQVVGTDAKVSTSDPAWREKVRKGVDASHYYSATKYKIRKTGSISLHTTKKFSATQLQDCVGVAWFRGNWTPIVPPSIADIDAIALANIKRSIAKDIDDFKSLVPIAELHEARKMIKGMVPKTAAMIEYLLQLRKHYGNKRYRKDVVKMAADRWLEFSFGISPTISDVNHLLKEVNDTLINPNDGNLKRYTGFDETGVVLTRPYNTNVYNTGHVSVMVSHEQYAKARVSYCAGVLPKAGYDNDYDLQAQFGLNFGEIVGAAWERIPYSWLVDYFTTTGEFMSEVFTTAPYRCVYVTRTVTQEDRRRTYPVLSTIPSNVTVVDFVPTPSDYSIFQIERVPMSSLPIPVIRFKTVDEVGQNAIKRLLNLGSLLITRIR